MISGKILAFCLFGTSLGTILAQAVPAPSGPMSVSQQAVVAWIGIATTAGLAALNLYQEIRKAKRAQDGEDMKLTASSDRALVAQLTSDNTHLREQVALLEGEVKRWLTLYHQVSETTEDFRRTDHHLTGESP